MGQLAIIVSLVRHNGLKCGLVYREYAYRNWLGNASLHGRVP